MELKSSRQKHVLTALSGSASIANVKSHEEATSSGEGLYLTTENEIFIKTKTSSDQQYIKVSIGSPSIHFKMYLETEAFEEFISVSLNFVTL